MLNQIVAKQSEFLELARRVRTEQLIIAAAQLCHMDEALAHHTWLRLFPSLWSCLDERQLPVNIFILASARGFASVVSESDLCGHNLSLYQNFKENPLLRD